MKIADENSKREIQRMIDATEDMIDALLLLKKALAAFDQHMYWLSMADPSHWHQLHNGLQMVDMSNYGLQWLKNNAKSLEKELHSL